jgi:hypothetical protein
MAVLSTIKTRIGLILDSLTWLINIYILQDLGGGAATKLAVAPPLILKIIKGNFTEEGKDYINT